MDSSITKFIAYCQQSGMFTDRQIRLGERVTGGTVNQCWILDVDADRYLARLGRQLPDAFLCNWQTELQANQVAAEAGLAPPPLLVNAETLSVLYPWCGQPLQKIKLSPEIIRQLAYRLAKLHDIAPPVAKVSYRKTITNYLDVITNQSNFAPSDKADIESAIELAKTWDDSEELCFCHHDLNPGNILLNDEICLFIDWEYARIAHPLFDLASLAKHYQLSDLEVVQLLHHYWREQYELEHVRSAETMVRALEKLWFCAAQLAIFNQSS